MAKNITKTASECIVENHQESVQQEPIISYKGFDKDLKCRDFQYEIGKEYEHVGKVKACSEGFHACEYPLDVFGYYPPRTSRYAIVEQSGKTDRESGGDSKVSSSHLKIKAEINISGIIKAAIDFTMSNAKAVPGVGSNTGDNGVGSNTGSYGVGSNTGYKGVGSNTGDNGVGSNTGNYGVGSNTGNYGVGSNTGYKGVGSNTGNYGVGSNTGNYGVGSNTGYKGVGSNTGDNGVGFDFGQEGEASTDGVNSIALGLGIQSRAKATEGNWIVLAFRDKENIIKFIVSAQAGVTKGVLPNVWYELNAKGKFSKVKS